jgi:hypothetical protein
MAEPADLDGIPQATVVPKKHARLSVVWIIPILVAGVAIGVAIQRILNEGPTITIVFKTAEGIEAGKTFVKYKDVNIGQVTAVQLTDDYGKVEVKAKIAKSAQGLMVEDAKFWTEHAALRQLHRIRCRQVGQEPAHLHRARCSADYYRSAGTSVRSQRRRSRIAGGRIADLLPPPAGRPGHRVRSRSRR